MLLNCHVGQDSWESPLDCKEIKPVNPEGNQSWIIIRRTDVEAETPIIWPSDVKNSLIEKDPDAGKDWRKEEKGTTEDEMVGSHHQFDGHEIEQAPGVGDEQGSLVYCNPWGWKELNTTEQLNWTELRVISGHGIDFHFLIMNCEHDCEMQFIHCIPPIGKFWAKKTVKLGRGRSWTKIGSQRSPELDYSGQSWHSTWLYLRIRCPCAGNSAGGTTPPSWRCM